LIFVLDPDTNQLSAEECHRMGLMALAFGFTSFAISLFLESGLCTTKELRAVETALARVPLRRKLKYAWQSFPQKVADLLARLNA